MSSKDIELVEVGPRDGLQNEVAEITIEQKIELVNSLSRCGFRRIEVGSFVSPRWVPQMAGSQDVFGGIRRQANIRYAALIPNLRGLEQAIEASADEIAIFVSASEGFSAANLNTSIADSLDKLSNVTRQARDHKLRVRGYISCVIACPYDGPTPPDKVTELAVQLVDLGCFEISLGDTIGAGRPNSVSRMLENVLKRLPASHLAGHYHDTGDSAVANIFVSIDHGIRSFDTSIAGLGGCPFAAGAPGNAATEKVDKALVDAGYQTGLEQTALHQAVKMAQAMVKS